MSVADSRTESRIERRMTTLKKVIEYIHEVVRMGGEQLLIYKDGKYATYTATLGLDNGVDSIARCILEDGWHPYYYKEYVETGYYMTWYMCIMDIIGINPSHCMEESMEHFKEKFICLFQTSSPVPSSPVPAASSR